MKIIKQIQDFNELAENHEADFSTDAIPTETLIGLKPILIAALRIIQFFTNDKADALIDKVIAWLEGLS